MKKTPNSSPLASKTKNSKATKQPTNDKVINSKALEVLAFSKRYSKKKDYAVKNVTFTVEHGEFHGFIGANGAGKTTTIKSIIGAYAKYQGQVKIFGFKNTTKESKKKLGYIPEAANFPKELNSLEYVAHMASISGMKYRKAREFAKKTLVQFGLGKFLKRNPNSLSSGQKKKVLLAQALVNDPDILVMDEPAANLDPQARSDFFTLLNKLQEAGKSIFISSHILTELGQFIDSVTILDKGQIMYTGKIKPLLAASEYAYNVEFSTTEEWAKFKAWLVKNKIPYKGSMIYEKAQVCDFKNKEMLQKALSFILKNQWNIIIFSRDRKTLQQVYDKYVNYSAENINLQKGINHA